MLTPKRTSLIAVLCALGLAGGASAISYATDSGDTAPAATADPRLAEMQAQFRGENPTTAVPDVEDAIVQTFPLFRNQPPSPIPAKIAAEIASPARFGRNPELARAIETPNGTGWAIPGRKYVCIAVPTPRPGSYGITCLPPDIAAKQGLWLRLSAEGENTKDIDTLVLPSDTDVVELAPDGSRTETLKASADGVVSAYIDSSDTSPGLTSAK